MRSRCGISRGPLPVSSVQLLALAVLATAASAERSLLEDNDPPYSGAFTLVQGTWVSGGGTPGCSGGLLAAACVAPGLAGVYDVLGAHVQTAPLGLLCAVSLLHSPPSKSSQPYSLSFLTRPGNIAVSSLSPQPGCPMLRGRFPAGGAFNPEAGSPSSPVILSEIADFGRAPDAPTNASSLQIAFPGGNAATLGTAGGECLVRFAIADGPFGAPTAQTSPFAALPASPRFQSHSRP